jgi:hypothetical protein
VHGAPAVLAHVPNAYLKGVRFDETWIPLLWMLRRKFTSNRGIDVAVMAADLHERSSRRCSEGQMAVLFNDMGHLRKAIASGDFLRADRDGKTAASTAAELGQG